MAAADPTIDERLRSAAMRHFLEHGFLGTNLQQICSEAGVTTGALYKRFDGKEGLFNSLVEDVYADLNNMATELLAFDVSVLSDEDLLAPWNDSGKSGLAWMRSFWEYGDPFKLLVRCAQGTRYSNFHHDFLARMTQVDYAYLLEAQRRGYARDDIDIDELHVLLTAQWEAYYEPFVHDFTWDQIEKHVAITARLFDWKRALGLKGVPSE